MSKKKSSVAKGSKNRNIVDSDLSRLFNIKLTYKLTEKQASFLEESKKSDTNIVLCDGPAGSSKTFCAVYVALQMLQQKQVDNIIYVRSVVESATRKLGSLPGEVDEKFRPWIIPFLEKCDELISRQAADSLIENGYVNCIPVNFLRGSTFKDCVVIVDEAQNLEISEIITILTRFGVNCKMFIIGDTQQSDINRSCFKNIFDTFDDEVSKKNGIHTFKFTEDDIVRSKILKFIVNKVKKLKQGQS